MHIIKNIGESFLGTFLELQGKNKDNIKSRLDLQYMGIRPELHMQEFGKRLHLPHAPYTLSLDSKHLFCEFFKELRVPDEFSSNISYSVNIKEHKNSGLKSHDYYVILKHFLPLAIRNLLNDKIVDPITELSSFFSILCAKVLDVGKLHEIESKIPFTLCKLEREFPPSFFDVMMHLPIHLATEAMIAGPAQFRWIFLIEQQLGVLKNLIRNRARPEASVAEGFFALECMDLCARYLHSVETKYNRLERNDDESCQKFSGKLFVFLQSRRPIGVGKVRLLDDFEWEQAHSYILKNTDEVQPYYQ
ncbi:hypothetical protein AXF42_Ash016488 [Apostasia shenzhenica]|uniref:DUF4218 domain-containing protein n=1 Tax=Apostasia shenzhenica TaxID=1088818 RepID=A0A2I0AV83_9ASPA|nr:hypothetical protein AXF42_Ash016488 [Apostasia shenzhenica]